MSYLKKVEKQHEKNRKAEWARKVRKSLATISATGSKLSAPVPLKEGEVSPFRKELDSMTSHLSKETIKKRKRVVEDESPGDDV